MARGRNVHDEDSDVEEVSQNGKEVVVDDEDDDEGEYEIEAILDAKDGSFLPTRPGMGYFVKWKGYDDDQNSWVHEEDAGNAQDLIRAYHDRLKAASAGRKSLGRTTSAPGKKRKSSTPVSDSEEKPIQKKRGRPLKSAPKSLSEDEEIPEAPPAKRAPRKSAAKKAQTANSDAMDEDEEETYVDMERRKDAPSWAHLVDHIDTVERRQDGELFVYFKLKATVTKDNGWCREASSLCKKKMPELLLDFYERNLRWRNLGPGDEN